MQSFFRFHSITTAHLHSITTAHLHSVTTPHLHSITTPHLHSITTPNLKVRASASSSHPLGERDAHLLTDGSGIYLDKDHHLVQVLPVAHHPQ